MKKHTTILGLDTPMYFLMLMGFLLILFICSILGAPPFPQEYYSIVLLMLVCYSTAVIINEIRQRA